LVFITIGTGVGIGLVINGKPVHGYQHPEGGHMEIARHESEKDYDGFCVFHGGKCVEGLVSNNSIAKRLKCSIEDL